MKRTERDEHRIPEGLDWYLARAIWYGTDPNTPPTLMPDLSGWTATYTVFPAGDTNETPVIGGDSGVTPTITLGIGGDQQAVTTLNGAVVEEASTVTLTSATGVSDGDQIAIFLDNDMIHVTTVDGAPSGAVVTLADALPDPAASGNAVKVYSPEFAIHNILIHLGHAVTSALEAWGQGTYNLDLIDPLGRPSLRFDGDALLAEGADHA